jgi:hypothetical protein
LWYEGKERRERDNDFNGEKGERLFLPRISFPLSLLLSSQFSQKKENSGGIKMIELIHKRDKKEIELLFTGNIVLETINRTEHIPHTLIQGIETVLINLKNISFIGHFTDCSCLLPHDPNSEP